MTDRKLIRDATPRLKAGDQVVTPSGRLAVVEGVDQARGEVFVRWPSETASFRPSHLRMADTRDGGGLVFLPDIKSRATVAEPVASGLDAKSATKARDDET